MNIHHWVGAEWTSEGEMRPGIVRRATETYYCWGGKGEEGGGRSREIENER